MEHVVDSEKKRRGEIVSTVENDARCDSAS